MTKLYKIIGIDGSPIHGGSGLWFLPKSGKPARWMPKVEGVEACRAGYHLIPAKAIVDWLPRKPVEGYLCEAEGRGAQSSDGDKIAFAQARLIKVVGVLDEVSMRLAAADMAERVLPIFYKVLPTDDRPAKAIQAARDFAHGKIGAAAWATAGDAAGAAAGAAAWATAGAAARDAAGAAARAAAWATAGAAARAAARAAAWATAGAAARDAAGAAARDANARIIIAQAEARLVTSKAA